MPLFEVVGGPIPPSGQTLVRAKLVVLYYKPYVADGIIYPVRWHAELDMNDGSWKPEGASNGTTFHIPGAVQGDSQNAPAMLMYESHEYTAGHKQEFYHPERRVIGDQLTNTWTFSETIITPPIPTIYIEGIWHQLSNWQGTIGITEALTVAVTVVSGPALDTEVEIGDTVTLSATPSYGVSPYTYSWRYWGSAGWTYLGTATTQEFTFFEEGEWALHVLVTDAIGNYVWGSTYWTIVESGTGIPSNAVMWDGEPVMWDGENVVWEE